MSRHRRISRTFGICFAIGLLTVLLIPFAPNALRAMQQMLALAPGDQLVVNCETGLTGQLNGTQATIDCAAPAQPTSEPAATGPVFHGLAGIAEGQVVSGPLAIEAQVSGQNIDRVEFQLDGPQPALHTERQAPYFFMGDTEGVPNGWDTSQFIAGDYTLTVTVFDTSGQSAAQAVHFQIVPASVPPVVPEAPPAATPIPPGHVAVPGIVEAEDASHFSDGDTPNHGGAYRSDALDVQACAPCVRGSQPGYNVGWIYLDEWLEYQLAFTETGTYKLRVRFATPNDGRVVRVRLNGTELSSMLELPNTGAWNAWSEAESVPFTADAGAATLRLEMVTSAFNLDMIEVIRLDENGLPVTPQPPAPTAPTVAPTVEMPPTPTTAPVEQPTVNPTAQPEPTATPEQPTPLPGDVSQAIAWQRWEQRLTSSTSYSNAYADLTLFVTYRGPDGTTLQTYGFWDGGQNFAIRAHFPSPGTWTWETRSEPADAGLTKQGSVNVQAASSSNPLYQHGALAVAPNGRYLMHTDGTPFLWMGDTAWDAPMKASEAQWRQYIDTRAAQGFSVVQIAPAASWFVKTDVDGNAPFIGSGITQWNPAYWQGFERKVQYANERGLVVALIGVQDPIDDTWPPIPDAQRFARAIVARLYGNHVVFAPSFDKEFSQLSDAVGEEIRKATSIHLITQHPGTPSGQKTNIWAEQYFDRGYLSFAGNQTGHNNGDRTLTTSQAIEWNLSLYRRSPTKPVINLEAFYDANGTMPDQGGKYSGTAYDARALGYLSWLSGSLGYTYGARTLMIWENSWANALNFPSASQMTVMRAFFDDIKWWTLRPVHERIANQSSDPTRRMALAASEDGTLVVAYLPENDTIQINMQGFAQGMAATWVSPETGQRQPASGSDNGGIASFTRPAGGDWILLLQAQ